MTDEEIKQKFKETYTEYMYGDTPLSPYFDIWCYAIEIMEQETDKLLDVINNQDVKIADSEKQNNELQHKIDQLQGFLDHDIEYDIEQENLRLKAQIEKMKCCQNCENNEGEYSISCWQACKNKDQWKLKE